MGFEPTRAEHNGLAVHRLNHSATSSDEGAGASIQSWRPMYNLPNALTSGKPAVVRVVRVTPMKG